MDSKHCSGQLPQDGTFVPSLPASQGDCVVLRYDAIRRATSYDVKLTPYEVYELSTLQSRLYVHSQLKRKNRHNNNNNKVVFRPWEHFVLAGEKYISDFNVL